MPRQSSITAETTGRSAPGLDLSVYVTLTVIAMGLACAVLRADRTPLSATVDAHRSILLTKINPNITSAAELGVLPGVGEALASRIVALRNERHESDRG